MRIAISGYEVIKCGVIKNLRLINCASKLKNNFFPIGQHAIGPGFTASTKRPSDGIGSFSNRITTLAFHILPRCPNPTDGIPVGDDVDKFSQNDAMPIQGNNSICLE